MSGRLKCKVGACARGIHSHHVTLTTFKLTTV